jgi:MFS family permease
MQQEQAVSSRILSRAAVVTAAAIFGLTYSLSAALIALDLAEKGLSETLIGFNAAMHAAGVLITAFLLPGITARLGLRRTVIAALVTAASVLALFPVLPVVWLWFPLRILLGGSSEALFVLSESWLNALSSEETRARAMGVYTAALSVGFALGPLILSVVGADGFLPYLVGTGLALISALFILSPRIETPKIEKPAHGNAFNYMRLAPLALAATALNAAIETSGLTFLPLYALSLGRPEDQATRLMACIMFGAVVLQLPIGWLGDKMNRSRLALYLAVVSALGAAFWPLVLQSAPATYGVLFLWGGAFVGIYTIMLTIVGSRFQGGELIGIYAAMGLLWGVGALLGPLLAGVSMQLMRHGLPFFVALACALFVAAWLSIKDKT